MTNTKPTPEQIEAAKELAHDLFGDGIPERESRMISEAFASREASLLARVAGLTVALEDANEWIEDTVGIASGEQQEFNDDTEALEHIDKRGRFVLKKLEPALADASPILSARLAQAKAEAMFELWQIAELSRIAASINGDENTKRAMENIKTEVKRRAAAYRKSGEEK